MSAHRVRRGCYVALLCGIGGAAIAGIVALVGPVGLLAVVLAVVLLAVTSPRAIRACRRGLGSLPRPTAAQFDALARSLASMSPTYVPVELTLDLRLLTDDQLDKAWSDSYTAVSSPSDPRAHLRAVEERGRYLAELERRAPSLLRAWLGSDAGAPDGSLPDLTPSRLEPATIDWDELTGGQATGP